MICDTVVLRDLIASIASITDSPAPHDGLNPSSPPSEGSVIERAMRGSLGAFPLNPKQSFGKEDHQKIARSGAADLSSKEAFALFENVHTHTESVPQQAKRRPIPLFFGHWSGMNPFRYVKPFFLSRKKDRP